MASAGRFLSRATVAPRRTPVATLRLPLLAHHPPPLAGGNTTARRTPARHAPRRPPSGRRLRTPPAVPGRSSPPGHTSRTRLQRHHQVAIGQPRVAAHRGRRAKCQQFGMGRWIVSRRYFVARSRQHRARAVQHDGAHGDPRHALPQPSPRPVQSPSVSMQKKNKT